MSLSLLLVVLLVVLLVGSVPAWPHSREWSYAPSGIITVLLVLLVLMLLGVLPSPHLR